MIRSVYILHNKVLFTFHLFTPTSPSIIKRCTKITVPDRLSRSSAHIDQRTLSEYVATSEACFNVSQSNTLLSQNRIHNRCTFFFQIDKPFGLCLKNRILICIHPAFMEDLQ